MAEKFLLCRIQDLKEIKADKSLGNISIIQKMAAIFVHKAVYYAILPPTKMESVHIAARLQTAKIAPLNPNVERMKRDKKSW